MQLAGGDITASNSALADGEDGAHLGFAQGFFHQFRLQQTFHRQLDVFQQLVDHVVVAHIHPGGIRRFLGAGGHGGVEAHDHRAGGGC